MTSQPEAIGLENFDVAIDRDAEVPIGVQLAWALRARIYDGSFKPGRRLPGVREVAEVTGMNVNTVRAAYQRLDQEGLIDSLQGSGTFVASTRRRPSDVATIAANAAQEAHQIGVDPRHVAAALYASPKPRTQPADEPAGRRRALRQQIAALELTLVEIEAKHPSVAPPSKKSPSSIGPALLDAAELEQVRTLLVQRLAIVQAAIDRLGTDEIAVEEDRQAAPSSNRAARPQPTTRPAPAGA